MQSKKLSLIESITNTVIGLFLGFCIQLIIYPVLDIDVKIYQNIIITFVFLLTSLIRSYIIRRIFTKIKL